MLAWFERLCDLEDPFGAALDGVPESVRDEVERMLVADRRDLGLGSVDVEWAIAASLLAESAPAETPMLPRTLGNYTVLAPLGSGGGGRVYEAEQESPRRRVAIKVLHGAGALASRDAVAEAQALVDVPHHGIPHVIEVGEQDGVAFLVMELIVGEHLDAWAAGRSTESIVQAVRQVCDALDAVHHAGILHRDLKPSNLVVNGEGRVYLVDFGLSHVPGGAGGTPAYLSPERLHGAEPSPASDVFALGVTLHEVLAGSRCFPSASLPSIRAELAARATEPRVPLSDPDLEAIVQWCLAPEERRCTARELGRDLTAYLERRPLRARPLGPGGRLRLAMRRHHQALAFGAIGPAAVTVGLLGVSVLRSHNERVLREADEARAAGELALLEEALSGEGLETIEARLERFVAGAGVRDTSAVVRAWLNHDRRCIAESDFACSRRTLTRAHLGARTDEERAEVRIALARQLAREQRWQGVLEVLGTPRTPEEVEQLWRAQVAVRDLAAALPGADPWVVPLLEQWTQATRFETRPIDVAVYGSTIWAVDMDQDQLRSPRVDGRPTQTIPLPRGSVPGFANPHLVRGGSPSLLQNADGRRTLRLWSIEDGVLRLRGEVPNERAPVGGWTLADVDGDGFSHLYVGSLYPDRTLWKLALDGSSRVAALPSGPSVGSDVTGLEAADLDGDGDDELLLSLGLWQGMDLQVFDHREGALRLVDRARLSGGVRAGFLRKPSGRAFIVAVSGFEGEGVAPPSAARLPPGMVIFEWKDGKLVERWRLPSPSTGVHTIARVVTGDFDGDGSSEIAAYVDGTQKLAWLVDIDEDEPRSFFVGGMEVYASAQLDEDPAEELLVRLADDDYHLWALGVGEQRVPLWNTGSMSTHDVGDDEVSELLRFGLDAEATRVLELRAATGTNARRARRDFRVAGRLALLQDRPSDALDLFEKASNGAEEDPTLEAERAEAARRAHRDLPPDWSSDALPPGLRLPRPGRVRWSEEQGLTFDAIALDGVLAELPVESLGDDFGFEIEVVVERQESGVVVAFEALDAKGEVLQRVQSLVWGGSGLLNRTVECVGDEVDGPLADYASLVPTSDEVSRHRIHSDIRGGEHLCELYRGGMSRLVRTRAAASNGPVASLRVSVLSTPGFEGSHARFSIRSLTLWGARPLGGPVEHQAWIEGRYDGAVAEGIEQRIALHEDLGETTRVRSLLDALDPDSDVGRRVLLGGLKRRPESWIPLVRSAYPERFGALYAAAWEASLGTHRGPAVLAAVDHPFVDDLPIVPALVPMLFRHAMLRYELGQYERARRLLRKVLASGHPELPPTAALALAAVEHGLGNADEARRLCREALAADRFHVVRDRIDDDPAVTNACREE